MSEVNKIINKKSPQTYPDVLKDLIRVVSYDAKDAEIFGSYTYSSQYFPSDIDIMEEVNVKVDDFSNEMIKVFNNVIKDLEKRPDIFLSELKFGLDTAYLLSINEGVKDKDGNLVSEWISNISDELARACENDPITESEIKVRIDGMKKKKL